MSSSSTRRALATVVTLVVAVVMATLSSVQPASAAPAAPSGLTPNSVSVSGLPVLQWNRVSGATAYEAQVATSDTFNTLIWSTSTYNRRVTPNLQLPGGTIHWRVRAVGSDGHQPVGRGVVHPSGTRGARAAGTRRRRGARLARRSPRSSRGRRSTARCSTPSRSAPTRSSWTPPATRPIPPRHRRTSCPTPSWRPSTTGASRPTLGSGVVTQWSHVRSYTIGGLAKPVLESPADSSATNLVDVVLDWEPVMGAKTYNLQISTDQNFNTIEHQPHSIMSTRYSPPATLDNDQYYWRVSPVDSAGNTLDWVDVDVWEFRRHWPDQPDLEYPAHNALVGDPFFYQWTPVRNASSYRLEVSPQPTSARTRCRHVHHGEHHVHTHGPGRLLPAVPGHLLLAGHRAMDGPPAGVVPDAISADVYRFTYNPTIVALSSPCDGPSVEIPTLRWQPMPGPPSTR